MSDDEQDYLPVLIERHPRLFRGKAPRCHSYVMRGWMQLVDELCGDLEQILGDRAGELEVVQLKEKFGTLRCYFDFAGRSQLIADLFGVRSAGAMDEVADEKGYVRRDDPTPAGTRMTLTPDNELAKQVAARVRAAEEASAQICETCGERGRLRVSGGLFLTACARHAPRGALTYETWRRRREAAAAAAAKAKKEGDDD